jgi:hypothetical protein
MFYRIRDDQSGGAALKNQGWEGGERGALSHVLPHQGRLERLGSTRFVPRVWTSPRGSRLPQPVRGLTSLRSAQPFP